jgi:hypothetical protein
MFKTTAFVRSMVCGGAVALSAACGATARDTHNAPEMTQLVCTPTMVPPQQSTTVSCKFSYRNTFDFIRGVNVNEVIGSGPNTTHVATLTVAGAPLKAVQGMSDFQFTLLPHTPGIYSVDFDLIDGRGEVIGLGGVELDFEVR